jgi:transposase
MQTVIDTLSSGVPTKLAELRKLGRTLKKRAGDILAFFDRPGTSNGPTEAINGRLEHLRGSALGFRNLDTRKVASWLASCREPGSAGAGPATTSTAGRPITTLPASRTEPS